MRALDTNLLVRLIARDHPAQRDVARAILAAGDVVILPTVLLEAEWVLRSRYRLGREHIVSGFRTLCAQPGVKVVSAAAVAKALIAYARAGDFADHLHLALSDEQGATAFVTFDRDLVALTSGPPVELIE